MSETHIEEPEALRLELNRVRDALKQATQRIDDLETVGIGMFWAGEGLAEKTIAEIRQLGLDAKQRLKLLEAICEAAESVVNVGTVDPKYDDNYVVVHLDFMESLERAFETARLTTGDSRPVPKSKSQERRFAHQIVPDQERRDG